jgi:hypothetical protein
MKKMAIFVEGQTEQMFVSKLVTEIAGEWNISIEKQKSFKRQSGIRKIQLLESVPNKPINGYYILIRDCGSDESVKSDIIESYEGLAKNNYERIIGLRDVYPLKRSVIGKLEKTLRIGLQQQPIPVDLLLAVMEIEAWFIAETSHFQRINPLLTNGLIKKHLLWDPMTVDIERRPHPSVDLDEIYRLVGLHYDKKRKTVQKTIGKLDYAIIYLELGEKVRRLQVFIDHLDSFFC